MTCRVASTTTAARARRVITACEVSDYPRSVKGAVMWNRTGSVTLAVPMRCAAATLQRTRTSAFVIQLVDTTRRRPHAATQRSEVTREFAATVASAEVVQPQQALTTSCASATRNTRVRRRSAAREGEVAAKRAPARLRATEVGISPMDLRVQLARLLRAPAYITSIQHARQAVSSHKTGSAARVLVASIMTVRFARAARHAVTTSTSRWHVRAEATLRKIGYAGSCKPQRGHCLDAILI